MKTNQDGGSVTASDPAAAGKQLAADQTKAAGPAKTRDDRKKSAIERKIKRKTASASKAAEQMGDAPSGSAKETRKLNKMRKKVKQRNALQEEQKDLANQMKDSVDGPGRMGYSQKFGPGRMNGYDASAKKVMDVMTYGGASRYMAEGPGQSYSVGKPDRSGEGEYGRRQRGVFASGDRAMQRGSNEVAYRHSAAVNGNLTQSQIKNQGPCGGPGQRPCGTNELSAAERSVVNDGDMNNYLSRQVSNTPRGKGFQARMDATLTQNRARQRTADSTYVVNRSNRNLLTFKRDFDNTSQGGRPGGRQKGNVIGRYNPIDPNTGTITDNRKALDPNTGSMTMTKSKANKKPKKA